MISEFYNIVITNNSKELIDILFTFDNNKSIYYNSINKKLIDEYGENNIPTTIYKDSIDYTKTSVCFISRRVTARLYLSYISAYLDEKLYWFHSNTKYSKMLNMEIIEPDLSISEDIRIYSMSDIEYIKSNVINNILEYLEELKGGDINEVK